MSIIEELTSEIDLIEMKLLRSLLRFRCWCFLRKKLKETRPPVDSVLKEFSLLKVIDELEPRFETFPLESTSEGRKRLIDTLRDQGAVGNGMCVRCISMVLFGFSAEGGNTMEPRIGGKEFGDVGACVAEALAWDLAGGSRNERCALCTFGTLQAQACDPALLPEGGTVDLAL